MITCGLGRVCVVTVVPMHIITIRKLEGVVSTLTLGKVPPGGEPLRRLSKDPSTQNFHRIFSPPFTSAFVVLLHSSSRMNKCIFLWITEYIKYHVRVDGDTGVLSTMRGREGSVDLGIMICSTSTDQRAISGVAMTV